MTDSNDDSLGTRDQLTAEKETPRVKVEDRRHWARAKPDADDEDDGDSTAAPSTHPTIVDEYRRRAEEAENRLREYIAAFKQAREDHEQFRLRLERDVDRKVELRFGEIVGELLGCLDDLEIAADHVRDVPEAAPLADGVDIVRRQFLSTLERHGVERLDPFGEPFDPNVAEALRVDPVQDDRDGRVTETVRPGYRLGERVIRPARVAVGKRTG